MFSLDVLVDLCRTILEILLKSANMQLMRIYFNISVFLSFVIQILLPRTKIRNAT